MRRRHYISSIFELVIPLVLSIAAALIFKNGQNPSDSDPHKPPTIYKTPQLKFSNGCPTSYKQFRANIWYV